MNRNKNSFLLFSDAGVSVVPGEWIADGILPELTFELDIFATWTFNVDVLQ